jgi:outer membrane protein OmpA-like peptidoglycan-associated protein
MKFTLSLFIVFFCFIQTAFGQATKSAFGVSIGSTQYKLDNILNNRIGYNYGNFGLHYYYKIDTSYFLLATYTNGGVPDNSGNPFGNYKDLKSSFNRGNLSLYKKIINRPNASLALGAGLGYQKAYFQCYNCNILANFRNDYNLNVGIHVEKKLSKNLAVFLLAEGAYSLLNSINDSKNIVVNNPLGGYDVLKNTASNHFNVNVGLKYTLHKRPKKPETDADKDSVVNSLDKCPDTPIGIKVDKDGCPIIQSIIDFSFKVKDADADGVVDSLDKCPQSKKGEIVNAAGCAQSQLDDDQDGIVNSMDKCPLEKGPISNHGCPEISKSIEQKVIEIANEINFVTNQAELLPSSLTKLNELILLLIENPEFNMVISGHTDDVGTDEFNLALSEKRTQRVIDYLVSKGIAKERMVGLSFGESKLKVNDSTENARSVNRRVEFKVFIKK